MKKEIVIEESKEEEMILYSLAELFKNDNFFNKTNKYFENIFININLVPDVIRYDFICHKSKTKIAWQLKQINSKNWKLISESKFHDFNYPQKTIKEKAIVLIIESPHNDEYQYLDINKDEIAICNSTKDKFEKIKNIKYINPIASAQGTTGNNIEKWLINILSNLNFEGICKYKIIISNPIQFQTSLHFLHGQSLSNNQTYSDLRDEVWTKLWSIPKYQTNFKKRLFNYKPYIVINSCTKNLREVINVFLLRNKTSFDRVYVTTHPSSWNISKNRYIYKLYETKK